MAKHKSKDHHRRERSATPTTPDATIETSIGSTHSPVQVKHEPSQSDDHATVHPSRRPFVPRIPTDRTPVTGLAVPSHREGNATQSTSRKRGTEFSSNTLASAAKSPKNKLTRSDLASTDVTLARRAKINEVTFSSLTGEKHSSSAGAMGTLVPGMSNSPAGTTGNQTFLFGMSPFKRKYDESTALTNRHVTAALPPRPHTEHTGRNGHGTHPDSKALVDPEASGVACKACGSLQHRTKNCHVPFRDGTVIICPFHDCTSFDKTDPEFHHLDGLAGFHRSWCALVSNYELAFRNRDTERVRYMLPQMFGTFVLDRKRKPFCRVLNLEVCPIRIAIEFSREFCQGQMPSGLEEAWPYTKLDTTKYEIRERLKNYDETGWEGMPPGELEKRSWDEIKQDYARGFIPPQVYTFWGGSERLCQQSSFKLAAAEMAQREVYKRDWDAEVELQTVEEAEDDNSSADEEGVEQSMADNDVLLEKMRSLSAKVDSVIRRLETSRGKQTAGELGTELASTAQGTHSDPIDIDTDGESVQWCVEGDGRLVRSS